MNPDADADPKNNNLHLYPGQLLTMWGGITNQATGIYYDQLLVPNTITEMKDYLRTHTVCQSN